ncbi:hypothetical protein HYDPIDRAFT_25315 [Hydnomerulius pinastri MD-312]|nr:hypothetical protein HYDPIDRAFT_25315 [Hydnomerulius pinastri MD-312]
MDTPSSVTLLKPRLRLLRRSPSPRMQDNGVDTTPHAGPSSARNHFMNFVDDEDELPTPRMPAKVIASPNDDPGPSSFTNSAATAIPADTPAARLRALLAREPRSPRNAPPIVSPAPPSEADSDFDPPRFGSSTSSVARENLKDIFSRALREPGDTPQKGRPRRNSIDTSQVEITPVVDRERVKHKGKRRSLSDEEAEKPRSDSSFRLSQAATFDTLRARLMSSQSQLMDQNLPTTIYNQSEIPLASTASTTPDHPHVATMLSRQFNSSPNTPPFATSTPQRSFQMPSQLGFQSNLLEQDSEMQRAMGDVLNSENEVSTSVPKITQPTAVPARSHSSLSIGGSAEGPDTKFRRASHEFQILPNLKRTEHTVKSTALKKKSAITIANENGTAPERCRGLVLPTFTTGIHKNSIAVIRRSSVHLHMPKHCLTSRWCRAVTRLDLFMDVLSDEEVLRPSGVLTTIAALDPAQ